MPHSHKIIEHAALCVAKLLIRQAKTLESTFYYIMQSICYMIPPVFVKPNTTRFVHGSAAVMFDMNVRR